jgi:hypothetical protein
MTYLRLGVVEECDRGANHKQAEENESNIAAHVGLVGVYLKIRR